MEQKSPNGSRPVRPVGGNGSMRNPNPGQRPRQQADAMPAPRQAQANRVPARPSPQRPLDNHNRALPPRPNAGSNQAFRPQAGNQALRPAPTRNEQTRPRQGNLRNGVLPPYPPQSEYRRPSSPAPVAPREANVMPPSNLRHGNGKAAKSKDKKRGSVPRWILILLDILIVVVIVAGLYFLIKPKLDEREAEQIKADLLGKLKNNAGQEVEIKVGKNVGVVSGEEVEPGFGGVNFVGNAADENGSDEVNITYVGRLVIPKIACNTPLSNEASVYSLRFGVGVFEEQAKLEEEGVTCIFGHRYITKGRDFNRLNEVEAGDVFYIDYNTTQKRYIYTVQRKDIIQQEELSSRVREHVPSAPKEVMLITCHPARFGDFSQRILIYAIPTKEEPIPAN